MSTLLGAGCLAILSGVNTRMAGSFTYPPALFAAWWTLVLAALACSSKTFLPISHSTLAIYIIGPCAMSIGGLLVLFASGRSSARSAKGYWQCRNRVLTASLFLLAVLLPVLWSRIQQLSADSGVRNFWIGVRLQTMRDSSLGLFDDLILFSTITAWAAFLEQQRLGSGRLRAVVAITLGVLYHVITASRLGALILIAGLVGIAMVHGKNMLRTVLTGALAVIVIFVGVALALNKGAEAGVSPADKAISMAQSFQLYSLGGAVAFDSVASGAIKPASSGRTYRVVYAAAHAFGYNVEPPQVTSEYVYTPLPTNVYSMYYPYFVDFGPAGVAVLTCILGMLFTAIYLGAKRGSAPLVVAYGLVFSYIVLSSADEYVFSLISMNVRTVLFIGLLYGFRAFPGYQCYPRLTLSS